MAHENLQQIEPMLWEIPQYGGMRVPGRIYASRKMVPRLTRDNALTQVVNVAHLPGIVGHSLAMPDIHWGYGFPIGGVAAFDLDQGVISPGGVGYDINCGVRLLRSDLELTDVRPHLETLVKTLFQNIPSGVGSRGPLKLKGEQFDRVLVEGARWAVDSGRGRPKDLPNIEEYGCLAGADPGLPSGRARQRGRDQLGTLGSGNHFLEIGHVEDVYDAEAAAAMGLTVGQVTIMIHTGSRGFGHQVCDDSIRVMLKACRQYGIELPDRQLCCAPLSSPEGREYFGAMAAAVNFAFANRQIITDLVRETVGEVLGQDAARCLDTVYEVAHNIAKLETHTVDGQERKLCVHRKGATRAFGPGRPELPEHYRELGQPVLIPGDMGTCSYVLLGREKAMQATFGSACHGAGRVMSRKQAIKAARGRKLVDEMRQRGVLVLARGRGTLAEEMPEAYKDVSEVVEVVHQAGLATKVARLRPVGVVKG
ncbi:MAG: RtcB family protein [bacterium]